jgi:CRISPR-associated endonuclease/helicase Cas3
VIALDLVRRGRHLWAKSSADPHDNVGHSLLGHLVDVGLVAAALLTMGRDELLHDIARELELEPEEARRLVVTLVALHDLGKATPVFQAKWLPGAPAEAQSVRQADVHHGRAGAILLKEWLRGRGIKPRPATVLANAVGVHHGNRLPENFARHSTYDPASLGEDAAPWHGWRDALCNDVEAVFGPIPEVAVRVTPSTELWARLAGLTSVADWIGSSLPLYGTVHDVGGYVIERRELVLKRLEEIRWSPGCRWWQLPEQPDAFASWFEFDSRMRNPRPLQLAVQKVAQSDGSPHLLIVEAPMGEGKTEAAFFTLVQPGAWRGGYLALPTQATSDAMHTRLAKFVAQHEERTTDIALAHGAARLRLPDVSPPRQTAEVAAAFTPAVAPADTSGIESVTTAESWFSAGRRELLAELGVGTIDQALLAVLPVKHHFVRLWALEGKVVVLDEVHAYDAYTGGLVIELVRWLAALNATVVLMSATLPDATRLALAAAYDEGRGREAQVLASSQYPRLTLVSDSGVQQVSFPASREQQVLVRPAPFAIEALAERIISAWRSGGAVACVVNLVDRAQKLYQLCRERGVDVELMHARMPLDERKEREARIVDRYGPSGTGNRHGIVIATQVLEQSLDLDFDVMFTDLAPIDLVLQRSGRMHRHAGRERTAHASPVLYIAGLGQPESGPERAALDSVYSKFILWRSWAILCIVDLASLPHDIDAWVQEVYGAAPMPALESFQEELLEAETEHRMQLASLAAAAKYTSLPAPARLATDAWGEAATDGEDRAAFRARLKTRMGDESETVLPIIRTPLGWQVPSQPAQVMSLTARYAASGWIAAALPKQMKTSRRKLLEKLRTAIPPRWWQQNARLKHFLPLELDQEGRLILDDSVRLDDELGLVFEDRREM